jgi:uncharacterized membrane protein
MSAHVNALNEAGSQSIPRLHLVDWARGLALVAMTLFHFGWDLELFGFVEPGFASQPAMVWFARCIASSFLFLVGVSLVLAHHKGINSRGFAKRLAVIAGAAGLITLATWFATPEIYIFFGILHHIAVASVLGLLFLRLPCWLIVLAATGTFLAFLYGKTDALNGPQWWWTGLNALTPRSSDYVPVFPFFAAVLGGMACAKAGLAFGWQHHLASLKLQDAGSRVLRFIGRHSLVYYLVHQPVMIAILFGIQTIIQSG